MKLYVYVSCTKDTDEVRKRIKKILRGEKEIPWRGIWTEEMPWTVRGNCLILYDTEPFTVEEELYAGNLEIVKVPAVEVEVPSTNSRELCLAYARAMNLPSFICLDR